MILPSISQTVSAAIVVYQTAPINLSIAPSGVYDYLWSNGDTTEDLQNVAAGNYMVTVTGTNDCTASVSIDIPNDTIIFDLTAILTPNTVCISANGAIDLSVSPAGNYTFAWSNGGTTEDLQSLAAGSYSVTVTEGASCTSTATFEVLNESGAPDISTVSTLCICGGNNGSIDATISPAAAYDYLWSTGDTTEDLENLLPGSYFVTVTGANGCSSTGSAVVADSVINFTATATIQPNNSCLAANGSIGLTLSIPGNFTLLWSNGTTSQDVQGLAPGSYSVTATLGASCNFSADYLVPDESEPPVIFESTIPALCGQSNGSIDLTVMPGIGNTYLWSNGATTEDLQNITSGIYSVICTGANGCVSTDTVEVPNENVAIFLSTAPTANTSCVIPNGALDLSVSTPGSYTVLWSNGATTEDLDGISSGIYSVTVTDVSGCSETTSATVDGPVLPTVSIEGPVSACEGESVTLLAARVFQSIYGQRGNRNRYYRL
ncbi:MAG: hypothetical protein IPJ40_16505 [Saprospirales bacterium]|nr:hypothetical protein [Saprospirales bacterium]